MSKNSLKIISGKWRSRPLDHPQDDPKVRPSRSMVRQSGLDILQSMVNLDGKIVADLCCGSGALGFEALSRGAAHAIFVDIGTRYVKQNIKKFALEPSTYTVYQGNVFSTNPAQAADVVLSDPPYDSTIAQGLLDKCEVYGKAGTIWILETAKQTELKSDKCELLKQRKIGKTMLWVFKQN